MAFQKLWATLLIAVATITTAIATHESKEVYIIPSDSNGLTCPTTNTEQCFTLQELYETQLQGTFKITSNTTLNFLPGEHIIGPQVPQGHFIIRDTENITLRGTQGVTIRCTQAFGLAFVNVSSLNINGMEIINCGAGISEDLVQDALYVHTKLGVGLQTALLALNIRPLTMNAVTIREGSGYGMLGINLLADSVIQFSNFERNNENSNTRQCWSPAEFDTIKCQGGNALFILADLPECPTQPSTYNFTIYRSRFSFGLNLIRGVGQSASQQIQYGSGLALTMKQRNYGINVNLIQSNFFGNSATANGANLHFTIYNTVVNSSVLMQTCSSAFGNAYFPLLNEQDRMKVIGDSAGLYFSHGILDRRISQYDCEYNSRGSEQEQEVVLFIKDSIFTHNDGGGIQLIFFGYPHSNSSVKQVVRTAIIKGTDISYNRGLFSSSLWALDKGLPGLSKHVQLVLDNVDITHNQIFNAATLFATEVEAIVSLQPFANARFNSMSNVTIHRCNFIGNDFSAISALKSNVYFEGRNTFRDNVALTGAALYLTRDSIAYLRPNAHLIFDNNNATRRGGAIYITGGAISPDTVTLGCSLQVYDPNLLRLPELQVEMTFINNTATQAGDAVYGGAIDTCPILSPSGFLYHNKTIFGNVTFDYVTNFTGQPKSNSLISSDAIDVCFCTKDHYDCITRNKTLSKYPGESFQISLIGLGQRNGNVPTVINTLSSVNRTKTFSGTGRECSNVTYQISSNRSMELLVAVAERTSITNQPTAIFVYLLPCPVGFALDNNTHRCTCHEKLRERNMTDCDIDSRIITRLPPYWLSNYSQHLLLHDHCPFDYCKTTPVRITMKEPDISKQCAFNRTGTLCGQCKEGLSLVFGTSRCLPCSNMYLTLFIALAVAGVVLVVFLFLFDLTVSIGTINGLIFYANIVKINEAIFFPPGDNSALKVFISWVNLDLGIETCFYNGMDSYAKAWFQFVFPLFIWFILIAIIAGARKSFTLARLCGNHAVPVLATLFLLSFTKLLRVIITALSLTTLAYPDGRRVLWLYDGNIEIGKGKHIALLLFAILFLVALILYSLLLLIVQQLRKFSDKKYLKWVSKYMPIFDAYLGPYKNKYGYWTGLLLTVRVTLALVFVFNIFGDPAVNLLVITLVVLFLTTLNFSVGGVYKNLYHTALEISFMINLIVLTSVTGYVRQTKGNQRAAVYTSTTIALGTFALILIHHTYTKLHSRYRKWQERTAEGRYETVSKGIDMDMELSDQTPIETVVDIHLHGQEAVPPSQNYVGNNDSNNREIQREDNIHVMPQNNVHNKDIENEATDNEGASQTWLISSP